MQLGEVKQTRQGHAARPGEPANTVRQEKAVSPSEAFRQARLVRPGQSARQEQEARLVQWYMQSGQVKQSGMFMQLGPDSQQPVKPENAVRQGQAVWARTSSHERTGSLASSNSLAGWARLPG